jgi:hypothetical protein
MPGTRVEGEEWFLVKCDMVEDRHIRHAFRAALWIAKRIHAIQIPIDSYDTAAVLLKL